MPLEMSGHIDDFFQSFDVTYQTKTSGYVNGLPAEMLSEPVPFMANVQPATDREINMLNLGNQRIIDVRKIYVNDGDLSIVKLNGLWNFLGETWKTMWLDNRYPRRSYCKAIVTRIDPQ